MLDIHALAPEPFVALCQALVQTPSVNGVNAEHAVAEKVFQFATAHGLSAELTGTNPERPNVLVRVGGDGPAGLLLVAHLDTVAPGRDEDWESPPFDAAIRDGRLYGRGAADTKGGLVAALAALVLLQRHSSAQLPAPVLLACVPDEENGATGQLGVRFLHSTGRLSGQGAIYVYPGTEELVIGHRGVLRLTLQATGRARHTGGSQWQHDSPRGNAVTTLAEVLLRLERYTFDARDMGLFAPFRTVITPTSIQGGTGPSMVPDQCAAQIDIRLVPSVSRTMITQAIHQVVAEVAQHRAPFQVDLREEVFLPPTQIAPSATIIQACQSAARTILGHELPLALSGPANESYILNELGIPTCILGPTGENVHAPNEYVVIDSIFQAAAMYAHVAQHLATSG